jgi:hypothetical protein
MANEHANARSKASPENRRKTGKANLARGEAHRWKPGQSGNPAATSLRDLAALPGNRFEALVGDRKGQYSIRINDQWRICFECADREPGPIKR